MKDRLESVVRNTPEWIEARYHARTTRTLTVRNGQLEESSSVRLVGVGLRALVDGVFGFASTTDLSAASIRRAADAAIAAARASAPAKRTRITRLATPGLAHGEFRVAASDPLDHHPLEEKLHLVMGMDAKLRAASSKIVSSAVGYGEILDEKWIVTSDGASAHIFDSKPELRVLAVAEMRGDQARSLETVGVTGGWSDLLSTRSPDTLVDRAARLAVDQLGADHPRGGEAVVILDPELVGILSHEAIGHTVEADIVLGGAVTAGKLGCRVASEHVTLCDSGASEFSPHAVGTIPVDDEGVLASRTVIIESGILRSYLHNRETAAQYEVEPGGNARAFLYSDEPIIRMTNTYIEPGDSPLEDLFAGVTDGYYLRGLGQSGQADSNAEFMFGVRETRRIVDGRIRELVRGATISGNAFDVLLSVDAVADDFAWENGAGYCGKGQAAKVDAGGPHIRCRCTLGGRQA